MNCDSYLFNLAGYPVFTVPVSGNLQDIRQVNSGIRPDIRCIPNFSSLGSESDLKGPDPQHCLKLCDAVGTPHESTQQYLYQFP
jgi:hypothetical protein